MKITISEKTVAALTILSAILWILLVVFSWMGGLDAALAGLLTGAALMFVYFILGVPIQGKINFLVPFIYPICTNLVIWVVAFILVYVTRGQSTGLILGMHPGFLSAMGVFWIGTLLSSTLAWRLFFSKEYLPDSDWDAFMKEVERAKK